MKIFYAVQATGNGHISRAMELVPQLQEYGHVDIFLSGSNGTLELDLPIKYRSKGLSLHYNCKGGLDFWKVFRGYEPFRMKQEIRDLPVEKYDLVLNDFDYITAAACARKKIPSIQFGHQASFQSLHTPRPLNRSMAGEWILDNYAKATTYVGLHFKAYDDFIFTPIIKSEIRTAEPSDKNHVTVYLPSYCEAQLTTIFQQFRDIRFEIFCFETKQPKSVNNIRFIPVNKTLFNNKLTLREGDQKNVLLLTSESELIQTLKREFAINISLYQGKLSDKIQFSSAFHPFT
ncbi:MAG: glycosyl transferase [Cytophagaceae bacterium]|nr:MAG: glycosyl transferase [Cytophagaceae bacterium]